MTPPNATKRRLATILAIDMAGYSAQAERDQEAAARAVRALSQRVRAHTEAHGGRLFNTAGDGFMAEFSAASDAISTALALIEDPDGVPIRIGAHVGEVVVMENGDLLGHGVNVAARLQSEAADGCALFSRAVADLVRGPLAERLRPAGRIELAKMNETIDAYAIAPAGGGARPGRRRNRSWIIAALAGGAVGLAALSMLSSLGLVQIGPTRDQMARDIAQRVTDRLNADTQATQVAADRRRDTIEGLGRSSLPADRTAFSFLREGETASAVAALESFAVEQERSGAREPAAAAFGRAGAVAMFHDKRRALQNFRRAYELAPNSLQRFSDLLQAIVSLEGYSAGFRFADETLTRPQPAPTAIRVYARLYASIMAGDLSRLDLQRRLIAEAQPDLQAANQPYLAALARIAAGYLAEGELQLARARALYTEGRRMLASVPGHERDHQHGWLLALLAMGDSATAWADGQAFIMERERAEAPPLPTMILYTCVAGLDLNRPDAAAPYCQAAARGLQGSLGEPIAEVGLAMLAAEENDLDAARKHLDAARRSRWFDTIPANAIYALRAEAQIAARARDFSAMKGAVQRARARIQANRELAQRAPIFIAWLELGSGGWALDLGERAFACTTLASAAAHYTAIGGDPGARRAEALRTGAGCPATPV
ncbi:MAG: adenylate/guanylate cyclase domain-containing protein [Hyphomonadaceae bacterium]|nr:adenylate/guanylate cyclase domain-containing protein [Hyphomonadaceae bacterium]